MSINEFRKYDSRGAYHWEAFNRSFKKHNPYLAGRYNIALELLKDAGATAGRALDIGCGDGALSYLLASNGFDVAGLDYSGTGLGLARKMLAGRGVHVSFFRGDSMQLPVKDESFDAVVAGDIIEHLPRPESMLEEIRRILKPGGAAVITTPVKLTETPVDPEHVREFTEPEFTQMLKGYFGEVRVTLSHPSGTVERYARVYRILGLFGKVRPYKYLYNAMSSYLGSNPFLSNDTRGRYTQMSAIARKL